MSKENVTAYWSKVQAEPDLRIVLGPLPSGSREEIATSLSRISSERGLPFTTEEFGQTAMLSGVALGAQALSGVAGGFLSNELASRMTFECPSFKFTTPRKSFFKP